MFLKYLINCKEQQQTWSITILQDKKKGTTTANDSIHAIDCLKEQKRGDKEHENFHFQLKKFPSFSLFIPKGGFVSLIFAKLITKYCGCRNGNLYWMLFFSFHFTFIFFSPFFFCGQFKINKSVKKKKRTHILFKALIEGNRVRFMNKDMKTESKKKIKCLNERKALHLSEKRRERKNSQLIFGCWPLLSSPAT